jgi:hypothetical protein
MAPLTPQDRLDVMGLIANYAHCIDYGDIEGHVASFLPDATLTRSNGARADGQDEIRDWVTKLVARLGVDPPTLRHFVGLPLIDGEGDTAKSQTLCVILDYDAEKRIRVPLVGRYEDTFSRVNGRWYFKHRIIHGDLGAAPR